MDTPDSDGFIALVERAFPGARLCAARRLTGGVSAHVHALDLEWPDGRRRTVVVRQHGAAGWRLQHGQVAQLEYALLRVLHAAGVPVPEPLLLDTSGSLRPGPFLVMAFVEGTTEVSPSRLAGSLDVMAANLARIHRLPVQNLPELPSRTDPLPELFDYLPDSRELVALRAHLAGRADTAYAGTPVLLHGDYWPGNLLWRDGRLAAILDWEDAAIGDPMSDVAGCRLELFWKHGMAAAHRFTSAYGRELPIDDKRLALWQIYVACAAAHFMGEWGLEPEREADMRNKAEQFTRDAATVLLAEQPT